VTFFVLDNSVAMRWCFDSGSHAYADMVLDVLAAGPGEAFAPVLWRYEVSAVLARAQRTEILTAERAAAFLDSLSALAIVVDTNGVDRILSDVHQLAATYRLTSYDAAYLELALRLNLPLATLDRELRNACAAAGVAVL
jgi:predicted nucleic acid-binding protein